jgi:transcriptional regulator with XRE-family HTH domain
MTKCKICGSSKVETRVVPKFSISELVGAPFPVVLENAVKEKVCVSCGNVVSHVIPEPDQLAAIVAVLRVCDPMKLNGDEIRFLRKSMGWKAKDLAERLAISVEHMSRFETGSIVITEVYERLLRALVCLGHHEATPHIDVDPSDIANMKITPACDVSRKPGLSLMMEKVPREMLQNTTKWKRDRAA